MFSPTVESHRVSREQKIHPCWKSFGEQLEELTAFEEGMASDVCVTPVVNFADRLRAEEDWVEFRMVAS